MERTLVLLKPDCVQRRLMGQIITRLENKGLNIVALKMLRISTELARQHYAEHLDKPFYRGLEQFITSAPAVAMLVEGPKAVAVVRKMLGPTSGLEAPAGTIRGDFGTSRQMNLAHASDTPEAAAREIGLYFTDDDICESELTLSRWLRATNE